jgi:hypothetical protein
LSKGNTVVASVSVFAGRQRFNVEDNVTVKLVLEEDGFEIDKDFYPRLHSMTQLMLLIEQEIWTKPSGLSNTLD